MGTLYVVGLPAGAAGDISLRALRILAEADLVVAADADSARRLLAKEHAVLAVAQLANIDIPLAMLGMGDVALLTTGWVPWPSGPSFDLIRAAVERGFSVVPVPGPAFSITALVLSGLPADSFVHLGALPQSRVELDSLLDVVSGERRTLVALASPGELPAILLELRDRLGLRPLVFVTESEKGVQAIWQGTTGDESGPEWAWEAPDGAIPLCALVIGGAQATETRWQEAQLRAEIQACLDQGLGSKEISRQLAARSGWPRRAVYQLAVDVASAGKGKK